MSKIILNFGMFVWSCRCGNFINYKSFEVENLKRYLEYAINPGIKRQFINYAFRCKKCGKIECLKLDVVKDEQYFVVKNGGRL